MQKNYQLLLSLLCFILIQIQISSAQCNNGSNSLYCSDTLLLSQNQFTHKLIIHKTKKSENDEDHINAINLFEHNSHLYIGGQDGVYKRSLGEITLSRENEDGCKTVLLYPPTSTSASNEFARVLDCGDGNEYDEFPDFSVVSPHGDRDFILFLKEYGTHKTYSFGPDSIQFSFDTFFQQDKSFLVFKSGSKLLANEYDHVLETGCSSCPYDRTIVSLEIATENENFFFEDSYFDHFSSDPLPAHLLDGCFVGDTAVLIGLKEEGLIHLYNSLDGSFSFTPWSNPKWPIKIDVIKDEPIFLLENDGLQVGFEDGTSQNLDFIMEAISNAGNTQPIAEIILDYDLGFTSSTKSTTQQNDFQFSLYPNPADDILMLDYKLVEIPNTIDYKILDPFGKCLQRGFIEDSVIHLEKLNAGIYYLQLGIDQNKSVEKFVIIK